MTDFILHTIHGSHLYGLAKPGSDADMYTVMRDDERKSQTVASGVDRVVRGLDGFMLLVNQGSHQAVEAAFSNVKNVHPDYERYLQSLRVTGAEVFGRYERTIKSFCFGDQKKRVHAVRLSMNLADLRYCGRFDPTMTSFQKKVALDHAELYSGEELHNKLRGELYD